MSFASIDHRLCFIHIPKAGGSSISEALKKSVPSIEKQHHLGTNDYRWSGSGHHTIYDYKEEFGRLPDWSFAVIRNPYERCVSAFMVHPDYGKKYHLLGADEKRMFHEWEKYLIFCERWNNEQRGQIYLPNRVTSLSALGPNVQGPAIHALPASYLITINSRIAVNTLIGMRDIDKVPELVRRHTGYQMFNLLHENKSDSAQYMNLLLTNDCKKAIERVYKEDFELYERAHE